MCKITKNEGQNAFYRQKIWLFAEKAVILHPLLTNRESKIRKSKITRSLRLSVRTRDFHSLKRSSTLLGTTKVKSVIGAGMRYHDEPRSGKRWQRGSENNEESSQGSLKRKTHRLYLKNSIIIKFKLLH